MINKLLHKLKNNKRFFNQFLERIKTKTIIIINSIVGFSIKFIPDIRIQKINT
jgi:hypothetical protein